MTEQAEPLPWALCAGTWGALGDPSTEQGVTLTPEQGDSPWSGVRAAQDKGW